MHTVLYRNHIVHVLPKLEISAAYTFVSTLIRNTPAYQHTVLHETPVMGLDTALSMQLQAYGADVLQADQITPELLDAGVYTGAMFYDLQGHTGLGEVLPSVYMSYGRTNPALGVDVVCPTSEYAAGHDRHGNLYVTPLDNQLVIPPLVQSRSMRRVRMRSKLKQFTVGLLSSGTDHKYPGAVAARLISRLPADIPLYLTMLPKYDHVGLPMMIEDRQRNGKLIGCALKPLAGFFYLLHLDVLVYATAKNYFEPAGSFVIEAAAAGVPVVCENRGMFSRTIVDGWNGLLFNTPDEAVAQVLRLKTDDKLRDQLAANGQLWASWYDVTVHLGRLKAVWRELGF